MSIFSSYKKIFLLGFIIVILIAIPLSVYIAQKRQQTQTHASRSTTLSFEPASPTVAVNQTLTLDVVLDPGSGSTANQVSFVKLIVNFDPLQFKNDSLAPNPSSANTLKSILEGPTYESDKASISLSIGANPVDAVKAITKIAILKLKALSATTSASVVFDPATQVLSIGSADQTSENVLSTTTPATVIITGLASPTLTPTPTSSAQQSGSASSAPTQTPAPASATLPRSAVQTSTPSTTTFGAIPPGELPNTVSIEPSPTIIVRQAITTIPPTGSFENILGVGLIGTVLTIVGGALLIFL